MEFTTLPPEVISALIHSGPGAESLANAAAAWQQLSANLEDAADNYASSLASMDESCYGPSSAAMFQPVTPYVTWLRTTAQQAQQTAAAARSAAAAFSTVQASVVPTATVAANRTRLVQLLATNVFGRNLPAIAQTESEYQTMWANNAAAMPRYQAASSQASTLPQLTSPTSTTNPSALSTQSTSAAPAAATSSGATVAAATPASPLPPAPAPPPPRRRPPPRPPRRGPRSRRPPRPAPYPLPAIPTSASSGWRIPTPTSSSRPDFRSNRSATWLRASRPRPCRA